MVMQWSSVFSRHTCAAVTMEQSGEGGAQSALSTSLEVQQQALLQHIHDLTQVDVVLPYGASGVTGGSLPLPRVVQHSFENHISKTVVLEQGLQTASSLQYHHYHVCEQRLRSHLAASGYYLYALCEIIV